MTLLDFSVNVLEIEGIGNLVRDDGDRSRLVATSALRSDFASFPSLPDDTRIEMIIRPYSPSDGDAVVSLSLRAWAPVFKSIEQALGPAVYWSTVGWSIFPAAKRNSKTLVCHAAGKRLVSILGKQTKVPLGKNPPSVAIAWMCG